VAQNDQGKPQDDRKPSQNPDKGGQQQQQDERKRQPGQQPDEGGRGGQQVGNDNDSRQNR